MDRHPSRCLSVLALVCLTCLSSVLSLSQTLPLLPTDNGAVSMAKINNSYSYLLTTKAPLASPIFTTSVSFSFITGSVQCLHVNAAGVISGTGFDCGSSSGSGANPNGYYWIGRSTNAPTNGVNLGLLTTGLLKITVAGNIATPSTAVSGVDYAPATSGTSIFKGNGTGGFANAASGTDYAPATSGASILYGNGSGGFSNVTIGSGLTFGSGILSATGGGSGMTWPAAAGIAVYTGSNSWGTSLTAPVGALVGTTDTQTLTNKTVDGVAPATFAFLDPTSSVQTQLNGKAPITSGSSILSGNGSGGFTNVTVGSGLSFAGGVLSNTGGAGSASNCSGATAVGLVVTIPATCTVIPYAGGAPVVAGANTTVTLPSGANGYVNVGFSALSGAGLWYAWVSTASGIGGAGLTGGVVLASPTCPNGAFCIAQVQYVTGTPGSVVDLTRNGNQQLTVFSGPGVTDTYGTGGRLVAVDTVACIATFAAPPGAPVIGKICMFVDATNTTTCSGGGSAKTTCIYDGSSWRRP